MINKKAVHICLAIGTGFLLLAYQNCAPMNFSKTTGQHNAIGNPDIIIDDGRELPDNDHGSIPHDPGTGNDLPGDDGSNQSSDAYCEAILTGNTDIKYASLPDQNSEFLSFTGADLKTPIDAENIQFAGRGAYDSVSITARHILEVGSMSVKSLVLNAVHVEQVGSMSVNSLAIVAHSLKNAESFAGTLCANVHEVSSIGKLAGKVSLFGRSSNGVKANIDSLHSMASFVSLHDIDIGEIRNGSFRGRIENGVVQRLAAGSGELYLVNSRIEKVSNFAGKIHLIGNSSIGKFENSSVQIIK